MLQRIKTFEPSLSYTYVIGCLSGCLYILKLLRWMKKLTKARAFWMYYINIRQDTIQGTCTHTIYNLTGWM